MKLIGTVADMEDVRKYLQKQQEESNGLLRKRSSKSKLATVRLIDPITQATNQAKMKMQRKTKKRKGSGRVNKGKQTKRKTTKKTKAGRGRKTSQSKSRRRKDNFTR